MYSNFTIRKVKNGFQLEVEGEDKVEGVDETKWYCDTYVFTSEAKLLKAIKILINDKGE